MNSHINKTYIGIGILGVVVGLLMLFAPDHCIRAVVIILGVFAIGNGIYNLVSIRKIIADSDFVRMMTIRGIVSIVVGLLAVLLPLFFAGIVWTVLLYSLAVYLIVSASMEIFATKKMKKVGIETKPYMAEIIGSFIVALLLFIIPVGIGKTIIRIAGLVLVLIGGFMLFWEWKNRPLVVYAEEVPQDPNEDINN